MTEMSTEAIAVDARDCLTHYYMKSYSAALPLCIEAAEAGDAQSQFALGMMYAEGKGMQKNDINAAKWLKAAAQQGHAAARYKLQKLNVYASDAARRHVVSTLWAKHTTPTEKRETEQLKASHDSAVEVFTEPVSVVPVQQDIQIQYIDVKPAPARKEQRGAVVTVQKNDAIRRLQPSEGLNSLETAQIGMSLAEDWAEDQQEQQRIRRSTQGYK